MAVRVLHSTASFACRQGRSAVAGFCLVACMHARAGGGGAAMCGDSLHAATPRSLHQHAGCAWRRAADPPGPACGPGAAAGWLRLGASRWSGARPGDEQQAPCHPGITRAQTFGICRLLSERLLLTTTRTAQAIALFDPGPGAPVQRPRLVQRTVVLVPAADRRVASLSSCPLSVRRRAGAHYHRDPVTADIHPARTLSPSFEL